VQFLPLLGCLWVAKTPSQNQAVDCAGFVRKLIGHVRDCLRASELPIILIPPQAPTRPGSSGATTPADHPQTANNKAKPPPVGSLPLGNVEARVARVKNTFDDFPPGDRHRLATSRIPDLDALDGASGQLPRRLPLVLCETAQHQGMLPAYPTQAETRTRNGGGHSGLRLLLLSRPL
jgi:hypothetical protein